MVEACFAPSNFRPGTISAWLALYVRARHEPGTGRLLRVYHARLRSNLLHALRPLAPEPEPLAAGIGALIDGLYLRHALERDPPAVAASVALVADYVERALRP